MEIKFISQYAGENAHYNTIKKLLMEESYTSFRSLNAFVTLSGLLLIDDELVDYLKRGNNISWIIGVDNGVTSKEALEYLRELIQEFSSQVQVKIFTSGSNNFIFHPKLYCIENKEDCVIITGSANTTEGGLLNNFELSMVANFKKNDSSGISTYEEFEKIWGQYSTPQAPLTKENLIDLMSDEGNDLLLRMEVTEAKEADKSKQEKASHPLNVNSKENEIRKYIKTLHNSEISDRKSKVKSEYKMDTVENDTLNGTNNVLIMDILTETRLTQVQFPVKAVHSFFSGITSINLYYKENNNIVFEGNRPIVVLDHNKTLRIELRRIKNFPRPLIMKLSPTPGGINNYKYELIDSTHVEFNWLDTLLQSQGNQSRAGSRRWVIL